MKKADAIIQARVGSTRLPEKVLFKVMDKTILEHVVERVRRAKNIGTIIVATTLRKEDLKIARIADALGVELYRGSEDDVLDRYYQAAKIFNVNRIARITADCPLIDPGIIDSVIRLYFESGADFCCNILERTFPDGEDVEVFNFKALECAWKKAGLLSEREHVTPYIKKHPSRFKLVNFKNDIDLSDKRWTLDRENDFKFIKAVIEGLYPSKPDFNMKDILEFLERNPDIENVNKGIVRNEGYIKSLREDRMVK